ncbi:MAG: AI-2E family transporter [Methyloceanibacter sp.]|uniref:AI-2E family transporter n=1 Tax=Methyloceanibacter sp. TaxID=1965321 RepID=UPI001D505DC5|nr:AI-2E family transporter [Methyloceanibacter sp.]MCB1442366.1 AI-2E family transporter [Methyloceanibacter sp.]MCC0058363.1 AI-2E family transporter [Hyphomicrobiaceae bacterium]
MSRDIKKNALQDKVFVALLVAVSVAFAWILLPFYSAVLWAVILATVFVPVQRWFRQRLPRSRNLAAFLTLLFIVGIVLIPLAFTMASIVSEATTLYGNIQSGDINFGQILQRFLNALPSWASDFLAHFGVTDVEDVQKRVIALLAEGSQFFATQAVLVGQGTANALLSVSIMLYLLFFLLRDGGVLARGIIRAVPLAGEYKNALFEKFAVVVRAMVKGTILVAIVQGFLGGLIFWVLGIHAPVLWGVVMAFLALLPAVGASIVWFPVAIYLLATGAIAKGLVLIAFGAGVIGLVDNLMRPYLVGKDTALPDYIVLISTLGGIAVLGLNGLVVGPLIAAMFIAVWDIAARNNGADDDGAETAQAAKDPSRSA